MSHPTPAIVRSLGGRQLTILVGAPLAFLQVFFLVGAVLLHSHEPRSLPIEDLPAEFHRHDFGWVTGDEILPLPLEDCLGCRVERAPSSPPPALSGLATTDPQALLTPPLPSGLYAHPERLPSSRAPPTT